MPYSTLHSRSNNQYLDSARTCAWIMFVNFSSAFNTIVPNILHLKVTQSTVPPSPVSGTQTQLRFIKPFGTRDIPA